jgi:3-phosphoshikimate 1-carboxyvinyltransferase
MSLFSVSSLPDLVQVTGLPSGSLHGQVMAPVSKSAMQRACAAAVLHQGSTTIWQPGRSKDDQAALRLIQDLGATVQDHTDHLIISSRGVVPQSAHIHAGESGLSMRMFTPIAALSERSIRIEGEGSLTTRPMAFFDEVLPLLGVRCETHQGRLPIQIQGPLVPADIEIDGSLSSQFLTGLLMAFSAAATGPATIRVKDLKSKPYIDLTLQVMEQCSMALPKVHQYETFVFDGVPSTKPTHIEYRVEGDWSAAAFLLVAGAIAGHMQVDGIDAFSTQADKAILQALMSAGAVLSIHADHVVASQAPLQAFHFNATDCPDLFPPLVALAAHCAGKTVIEGVSRLVHKESNRAATLQSEFAKLGVPISIQDDWMIIEGKQAIQSALCSSHHDHRIAMALATAILPTDATVRIEHAAAIAKSYPKFYADMQSVGVIIQNH